MPRKDTISLVAVDLDGTLLTNAGSVAPEGGALLQEASRQGMYVVLTTTRNPDSVQGFCRPLGIDDPIICTNGAQVWGSPNGPVWGCLPIPKEAALTIAQLADAHQWELSTTIGSMTYWRRRPNQQLGQVTPNITVVPTNSDGITGEPVRILVNQPEAVDAVRSLCKSELFDQCYAETYYEPDGAVHSLGVFSLRANKGTGLALVLDRLGIEPAEVMAIGDNPDDLPMFRLAALSVAMANAPDSVRQEATVIAPSNDEEGVAWALKTCGALGGTRKS